MMKKKIVQLIHALNTGGAETLVKEYALHLDREKYQVFVLCYTHIPTPYDELLKKAGIKIIYTDEEQLFNINGRIGKALNKIQRYLLIKRELKRIDPDIVHAHLSTNQLLQFAGLKKKVKVFYTVHNEPAKYWINGPKADANEFRAAKRNVVKYGMRFIALHEQMKEEINTLFGVKDTVVLNNGIDFERFNNIVPREAEREKLGISQDAFVIGHIGRFSEAKNHGFLVRVFAEVARQNVKAFLLMIGSGELRASVENELCNLGMKGRYMILDNRSDIPELLSTMDAFVFPSKWEGLSVSLIEAQKMGVPCFISENIKEAACISNLVMRLDISNEQIWAKSILDYKKKTIEYYGIEQWNIVETVQKLEKIYEGII